MDRARDGGFATTFVAVISVTMIFITGLVIDGGRRIAGYMRASDLASNAARAGAQAADRDILYGTGETALDAASAEAAALDFLGTACSDCGADVEIVGADQVRVTVSLTPQSLLFEWVESDVSASATSTALTGVDEAEPTAPPGGSG